MGPFVGFRHSLDRGEHWTEPVGDDGKPLAVNNSLFKERPGSPIRFGAPHVVDHGTCRADIVLNC